MKLPVAPSAESVEAGSLPGQLLGIKGRQRLATAGLLEKDVGRLCDGDWCGALGEDGGAWHLSPRATKLAKHNFDAVAVRCRSSPKASDWEIVSDHACGLVSRGWFRKAALGLMHHSKEGNPKEASSKRRREAASRPNLANCKTKGGIWDGENSSDRGNDVALDPLAKSLPHPS